MYVNAVMLNGLKIQAESLNFEEKTQYFPSKCLEPLAQRHGVTFQKTWILGSTAVRNSYLDKFVILAINYIP
jgi:hypothetical protein